MEFNLKVNNIWFSSDFHYGHKNITGEKVSEWKSGFRIFDSTDQMNDTIVNNINNCVKEKDLLFCLGDWSFGGYENIKKFRDRVVCKSIFLTYGNHDKNIRNHPEHRSLFIYCSDSMNIKIENYEFYLHHFSHQVWERHHKGRIHLFGHSHGALEGLGKSMDVGIDMAYKIFGEYRPFSFKEIIDIMNKKEIHYIDHHDNKTRE